MAGIETIASIVGVAGVGIKLAKTLYQVGHRTANAHHNINRIATNVSLFASMLKHVGSVLDDAHSLHSPDAIETVKQIINECESVFKEIADIVVLARDKSDGATNPPLANGGKRRISMIARAKWYFEGPKAQHLLAQLEYLKTTLSVLLQTLNLAALTAKINATLGQTDKPPEIVQQERLHVETLIVAQQLSVHTLHETREKLDYESTRPSSPSQDNSIEPRYPKLLTQGSQTSLQMVRMGDNDLEFLDRRPSVTTEDSAPIDPSTSRADAFIDDLLARWTVTPEEKVVELQENGIFLEEDQEDLERQATPVPAVTRGKLDDTEVAKNGTPHAVPNISDTSPTSLAATSALSPLQWTPSQQWTSPPSDNATVASSDPPASKMPLSASGLPDSPTKVPGPPRGGLERSFTNPEADGMPTLNAFHDHHGLQAPNPVIHPANTRMPPPTIVPPTNPVTPHHVNGLAPYMAGAAAASGNVHLSPGLGNYRQPYVSDEDSVCNGSDSDDSEADENVKKASAARPRGDSNATNSTSTSRRRRVTFRENAKSGDVGDGLGIPWRIRVSGTKYFDFRDDILMGPRTPYLPSESRPWIYKQENASTEISNQWVCEEALNELRYRYMKIRDGPDVVAIAGEKPGWRIMVPLKFHEIDTLVNRTVQYVEQARTRKLNGALPITPVATRGANGYNTSPVQTQQHPHLTNRSVSYNDGPPPVPALATTPQGRALPLKGKVPPRESATMMSSPRERSHRIEWPDSHRDRDRDCERERNREHLKEYERERDREHDRDRDRERQRPSGRSKPKRKEKEKEKERERDYSERRKEKHKSSGMGSTLAKVGTLAMLLEGLDGAF